MSNRGAAKSSNETSDANAAWEAQDGIDNDYQARMAEKLPPLAKHTAINAAMNRERVRTERPRQWRNSILGITTPTSKLDIKVQDESMLNAWNRRFKSETWNPANDDLPLPPVSEAVAAFDEEGFRKKVGSIRWRLGQSAKSGDVRSAERLFADLQRLQLTIPAPLDRLHIKCKSVWIDMLAIYVTCGPYERLKSSLDKFEHIYGLHASDRAMFTLRHFMALNLTDMALQFWRDADREGIVDETSYSDMILWLSDKAELKAEAQKIIDSAFLRAKTGRPLLSNGARFELTIKFYSAVARFYIRQNDSRRLKGFCESIVNSDLYGIGPSSFTTWIDEINNIVFSPQHRARFILSSQGNQAPLQATPSTPSSFSSQSSRQLDLDRKSVV